MSLTSQLAPQIRGTWQSAMNKVIILFLVLHYILFC